MEVGLSIAFWTLAVITIGSALAVVLLGNVFRAALFLVFSFVGVAGLYVTMSADFLAAVQILIYAGAIAILIIFAIMLTPNVAQGNPWSRWRLPAFVLAAALMAVLIAVVVTTSWHPGPEVVDAPTTAAIAFGLFDKDRGFVLPFEVASVLLLAAIIGAIALVRER